MKEGERRRIGNWERGRGREGSGEETEWDMKRMRRRSADRADSGRVLLVVRHPLAQKF